jgi:iron complex outermembrane recepter protein
MIRLSPRAALLATALVLPTAAFADPGDVTPATGAPVSDQTTSATQAGQANDKQALTTSDIIVTGSRTAESAPLTASLTTTQPQSAVSRDYIENTTATADVNELIALTPGVSISGTGNGYGLGETKATIRGFQDGEYNVTYDSIPFADTNNPTHHSTAFFPSNTIETVVVDRGPGNASQLGQASYGGNINMYSRAATPDAEAKAEAIVGNWSTFLARALFESGSIDKLGGTRIVLTGQYLTSHGALTYSSVGSKNLFGKAVVPVGAHNTLTVMSSWNRNFYYQSDVLKGATCGSAATDAYNAANPKATTTTALGPDGQPLGQLNAQGCSASSQVGMYGFNYGLGNDPTQHDYWRYNRTDKTTDFSYLRLQSDLGGGLSLDNRAYMYGYTNNTLSGNGSSSFGLASKTATLPTFLVKSTGVVTGFTGAGTAASPYGRQRRAGL